MALLRHLAVPAKLESAMASTLTFLLASAISANCAMAADQEPMPIPQNFLIGTAIAGFQVEMGCPNLTSEVCEDRSSDWYAFITSPWTVRDPLLFMSGDSPKVGPGFLETYRDDLTLASKELGSNALRVSLEWSRLFPQSTVGVDGYEQLRNLASAPALAYYHDLFSAMKDRKLTPMVTLNHYTLPNWIHDAVGCHLSLRTCAHRGWVDKDIIVSEISKFAAFAAQEFGAEVDDWLTLNEPFSAVVLPSYLLPTPERTNPPGVFMHVEAAKIANLAMIEAHARMYDAIHRVDIWSRTPGGQAANVGIAYSFFAIRAATERHLDVAMAQNLRYFFHDQFMNAITLGRLDRDWNGRIVQRPDLAGRLDFVGVNYYVRLTPPTFLRGRSSLISPLLNFDPLESVFDRNAPDGLLQVLREESRYGLPLYVTETGCDAVNDEDKPRRWLLSTLAATRQALEEGVDVRGYFYWTLMDNYEWNHGANSQFGLFHIDPKDDLKRRIPRSAVSAFRDVTTTGLLP